MALAEGNIADLVSALLSVNKYPLERAVALMPAFKDRGLLDPARVMAFRRGECAQAVLDAGYQRGGFVPIIAFRLYPLMEAIASGQLDSLPVAVSQGDKASFTATLTKVHGFGPRVADVAWMLWTAS